MKKITIIFTALLMILLSSCGGQKTVGDGTLKVALSDDYPPMEYRDENNELVGFDIDFIKALEEQLGTKIEIITTAWDGIFVGLNADKYDMIISTTGITKERQEGFEQSVPYLASGQVVVVGKDNENIKDVEDLAGKKIAVQIESTGDKAATEKSEQMGFEITRYDEIVGAFNDLKSKRQDAVVVDYLVAMEYVAKNGADLVITPINLMNEPLAVTMKKGNTDLKKKIDIAIKELQKDGTMKKISTKWFNDDYTSNIDEEIK